MAVDVESLLVRIDASTETLRREMRRAEQTVGTGSRRMEQQVRRVDRSMDRLNRTAGQLRTALGLLGVGVSIRGLQSLTTGALTAADALANTADRVGVSIEGLQELRYSAEQVGVASNTLDMAMQRFTRRVGEAANGTGELKGILDQLNIATRDGNGNIRASEEVLLDLADAIAQAETPADQLRIAFKAFDSEGAALVNIMRDGRRGLQRFAKEARDTGRVMDRDLVRSASNLNTQFKNLFATIRTQIQEGLLTSLTSDMEDLSDVATDPSFHSGLNAVGSAIGFLGRQVTGMVADFGRFVELIRDPSFQGLIEFGGRFMERSTFGLISPDPDAEKAMGRVLEINQQITEARRRLAEIEETKYLPNRAKRVALVQEEIKALEEERQKLQSLFDPSNDEDVVTLPTIRVPGDPPEPPGGGGGVTTTGTTVDAGAQAALAAMQQAAQVRDAYAESVGQMLTSLRQEAEENELILQHMGGQSGELETQQRLLEIRRELGQDVADQAEPMLRHIQEQTAAIERQQSAYDFLEDAAGRAFDRIGATMTQMFMEGEDAAVTFSNTVNAILSEIMQTMMQMAVINPLKNALFGGNAATMGDMGGILGSLFHSGGIVGGATATRNVNPMVFAGAPRMHNGGLAGYEVPAILKKGEEVLTESDPRHRNNFSGGMKFNLNIINNAGVEVSAGKPQPDGNGGMSMEVMLDEAVGRKIGQFGSKSNQALRAGFGVTPALARR